MRNKKAKALRRVAREESVGNIYSEYDRRLEYKALRGLVLGPIRLSSWCTKFKMKQLKKSVL